MSVNTILRWKSWPMPAKLVFFGLSISMVAIVTLTALQQRAVRNAAVDSATYTLQVVARERADRVTELFAEMQSQVTEFAKADSTVSALSQFEAAFDALPSQTDGILAKSEPAMRTYFTREFSTRLRDAGQPDRGPDAYTPRSEAGRIAQYMYIADNPEPVGGKDPFVRSPIDSDYTTLHATFHPVASEVRIMTGAYDIFLVDNDGDVIYSVFKETDYATNLLNGPFAGSGFADAYKQARSLARDDVYTTDYADYEPS